MPSEESERRNDALVASFAINYKPGNGAPAVQAVVIEAALEFARENNVLAELVNAIGEDFQILEYMNGSVDLLPSGRDWKKVEAEIRERIEEAIEAAYKEAIKGNRSPSPRAATRRSRSRR